MKEEENSKWKSLVKCIRTGEITVLALTSPLELVQEGIMMKNSAGSYAKVCQDGTSRIFPLRRGGKRTATMEIALETGAGGDDRWRLAQVYAPMNEIAGEAERAAAQETALACSRAWTSGEDRARPE